MKIMHNIRVNLTRRENIPQIYVSQNDSQSRYVKAFLFEGAVPFLVPEGVSASLAFKKPDRTGGWYDEMPDGSVAASAEGNQITIALIDEIFQVAGKVSASIVLRNGNLEQLAVFPFAINVVENPAADRQISNSYYKIRSLADLNLVMDEKMDKGKADRPLDMAGYQIFAVGGVDICPEGDNEGVRVAVEREANEDGVLNKASIRFTETTADNPVTLKNIADGAEDSDAATVGQLNAAIHPVTDEKYFSIDDDGMVSLNSDYRNGGAQDADLPERIVIPDIINEISVRSLAPSMFQQNKSVKSLTIPGYITEIPENFCDRAMSLEEINGTENVTTIYKTAFQGTRLKKAIFPNLKSFDGASHFNLSAFLTTVDIGNEVTEVPEGCFRQCERLTDIIGGANVKTIGKRAFYCTYSLRNLPFAPNLTAIGEAGIYHSGVNYNWRYHHGCTFGTAATWAQYNDTDYWSSVNAKECSIALRSTFSQMNPQWKEDAIAAGFPEEEGRDHVTYADSCATASQAAVYSAYNGADLISPVEYMIAVRDSQIHPGVMDIIGPGDTYGKEGDDGTVLWMEAVGFNVEKLYIDTTDTKEAGTQVLQKVYDALAAGKFVIADVVSNTTANYGKLGHAVVLYGVNSAGEFLIVDSSNNSSSFGDYSAIKYAMHVQNFAPIPTAFYIISKGE